MKSKVWFYLFWILFVIMFFTFAIMVYSHFSASQYKKADVGSYLEDQLAYREAYGGYVPKDGYIPDAKTAAKVAEAIVDATFSDRLNVFPATLVEYDAESRLWKVNVGYLFHQGATIVLNQDTGEVLDIVFHK